MTKYQARVVVREELAVQLVGGGKEWSLDKEESAEVYAMLDEFNFANRETDYADMTKVELLAAMTAKFNEYWEASNMLPGEMQGGLTAQEVIDLNAKEEASKLPTHATFEEFLEAHPIYNWGKGRGL